MGCIVGSAIHPSKSLLSRRPPSISPSCTASRLAQIYNTHREKTSSGDRGPARAYADKARSSPQAGCEGYAKESAKAIALGCILTTFFSSIEFTWTLLHTMVDNLKMKVNSGYPTDVSAPTHAANHLSLRDLVSDTHREITHMSI